MNQVALLLFALGWLCQAALSDRIGNETLLKKNLMRGYDRTVLPTTKINLPVLVNFGTRVVRIIEIDEVRQSIQLYLWGRQTWNDPRLAWNSSEYEGITDINIMSYEIWLPDTTLYSRLPPENFAQIPVSCGLSSKGVVTWLSPIQLASTCIMYLRSYPSDQQTCTFVFGSWGNDGGKIDYSMPPIADATGDYIKNGQWNLVDLNITRHSLKYSCCPNPYIDITYTLKVERDQRYPILNFVVPSVLLSILSILTFLLPPESGERITLSITILLSTTLFQQLTASLIPPSQVPVISLFYFSSLLMNCLSLVATTIILRSFFHTSETRMNRRLYKVGVIWLGCLMRCQCTSRRSKVQQSNSSGSTEGIVNTSEEKEIAVISSPENQREVRKRKATQHSSHEEQRAKYKEEWLELVIILDRFCLFIFSMLTVVTWTVIWVH